MKYYISNTPLEWLSWFRAVLLLDFRRVKVILGMSLLFAISFYHFGCDSQYVSHGPTNSILHYENPGGYRPITNMIDSNIYGRTNSRTPPNVIRQSAVVQRKPASPARQCRINKACPDLGHGTTISPSWRSTTTTSTTTTTRSPTPATTTRSPTIVTTIRPAALTTTPSPLSSTMTVNNHNLTDTSMFTTKTPTRMTTTRMPTTTPLYPRSVINTNMTNSSVVHSPVIGVNISNYTQIDNSTAVHLNITTPIPLTIVAQ